MKVKISDPNVPREPVSIVMIGAGNRARKYLEYIIATPSRARVVGVVEPNALRRNAMADHCNLPAEARYDSVESFFNAGKIADGVIIATPDVYHYEHSMRAISLGYHVLLEKPIAQTDAEAVEIAGAAARAGVVCNVCYVLHFHPYFVKLRELARSGRLGRIVSVSHRSPVGIDRSTHVYVRGAWGRKETSGPLLTSKCCHDIDYILWLTGSRCRRVSSYGSLGWFTRENAPEGSASRCIDCAVEATCPYSAVDLYRNRREWINNFDVPEGTTMSQAIERELSSGPYGQCVYRCDNDVVDRQVVAMEMESGVTVDFAMDLFTPDCRRTTRIIMTNGEIIGDERSITVNKLRPRESEYYDFSDLMGAPFHAGADLMTVGNFIDAINGLPDDSNTDIVSVLESQRVCDAIEESRLGR